jgi:hypothetical protein
MTSVAFNTSICDILVEMFKKTLTHLKATNKFRKKKCQCSKIPICIDRVCLGCKNLRFSIVCKLKLKMLQYISSETDPQTRTQLQDAFDSFTFLFNSRRIRHFVGHALPYYLHVPYPMNDPTFWLTILEIHFQKHIRTFCFPNIQIDNLFVVKSVIQKIHTNDLFFIKM